MKSLQFLLSILLLCTLIALGGGCSLNKTSGTTKPNPVLEKKKKHDQLYQELIQNAIPQGTSTKVIKERFGEPDDTFKSGSTTSSFESWTYDKMLVDKHEPADWDSILLYFDNGRLMSWKY